MFDVYETRLFIAFKAASRTTRSRLGEAIVTELTIPIANFWMIKFVDLSAVLTKLRKVLLNQ